VIAVLTSIYFLFGLALTSLVIGLIQERLEPTLNMLTRRAAFLLGLRPAPRVKTVSEGEYLLDEGGIIKMD
jgi:hypothetical protein